MAGFTWRTVHRVAALVILLFTVPAAALAQKPGQFSGDLVLRHPRLLLCDQVAPLEGCSQGLP
jgi:hypothetical protein